MSAGPTAMQRIEATTQRWLWQAPLVDLESEHARLSRIAARHAYDARRLAQFLGVIRATIDARIAAAS